MMYQEPDTIILAAIYGADVEKISEVLKKSWRQIYLLAIMRAIELTKLSIELGNAPHHAMFES